MFKATNLGLLAIILAAGLLLGADRSYVSGNFFFSLDGKTAGWMKSVEGGSVSGQVAIDSPQGEPIQKKHIGGVKYEDFTLQLNPTINPDAISWIQGLLDLKPQRKNGSVIAADYNLKAVSERDFFNALITEVTIPKLDGSSKEAGYLTVKIASSEIKHATPNGKLLPAVQPKQKLWLPSAFRLAIDNLDCSRVSKIESFTVRQEALFEPVTGIRVPGRIEFPNLTITLSQVSSDSWYKWHQEFVINGKSTDAQERSGTLDFLAPDMKTTLWQLVFHNLGIISVDPAEENGASSVNQVKAELYCEQMQLKAAAPAQ